MTEEEYREAMIEVLTRIAVALEGNQRVIPPNGGPERPMGGRRTRELVESLATEKVTIFADAMIEELDKPGGSTKSRWENARDKLA